MSRRPDENGRGLEGHGVLCTLGADGSSHPLIDVCRGKCKVPTTAPAATRPLPHGSGQRSPVSVPVPVTVSITVSITVAVSSAVSISVPVSAAGVSVQLH